MHSEDERRPRRNNDERTDGSGYWRAQRIGRFDAPPPLDYKDLQSAVRVQALEEQVHDREVEHHGGESDDREVGGA